MHPRHQSVPHPSGAHNVKASDLPCVMLIMVSDGYHVLNLGLKCEHSTEKTTKAKA